MSGRSKLVLGLMSGSSLDGLDFALVEFDSDFISKRKWKLLSAETQPFSPTWIATLRNANRADAKALDLSFGNYLSELIKTYLAKQPLQPELIALHGHTLVHEPDNFLSLQLGSAQAIATHTGIPAMDDFRTQDILLGGQGAPLAPTIEHWLLGAHQSFLNIGGILNLSYHQGDNIIAFDIGAGNQLLNKLANEADLEFDDNGKLAASGNVQKDLLIRAKDNPFYTQPYPKSLSNQWVQSEVIPLFQNKNTALKDRLATAIELIAWEFNLACEQINLSDTSILITGGGAFNGYLMEQMSNSVADKNIELILPDSEIINSKEAILMALMGYLNISGNNNVFGISTGSNVNHCAGNLCVPKGN